MSLSTLTRNYGDVSTRSCCGGQAILGSELGQERGQILAGEGPLERAEPRIIARNLSIPKDQAADVKKAVKRLVRLGQIQYAANHLVMPILVAEAAKAQAAAEDAALDKRILEKLALRLPRLRKNPPPANPRQIAGKIAPGRVVGMFSRTAKGFGFVRLAGTGKMPVAPRHDRPAEKELEDIYIPAKYAGDASTGDTVVVQISKRRHGEPGPRGEIVEILERQTHQFVGTYFESRGAAYVQVDGTLFAQPISVGDPGAKNAQPDDKVVIEMVRFPSPLHDGEGVITEVLGPRGKPGVDTLSIIREFNLPEPFAEDALDDARQQAEQFDEIDARRPHRPDRRDDRHDRPGRRPRFRRRDFARTARQRPLAAGRAHRRRLAFRPARNRRSTARPATGPRASICPTA